MKIFLAGATGVIGQPLLEKLVDRGHDVTAITRSPEKTSLIEERGGKALVCNVFEKEKLFSLVEKASPDVIVHELTAIPDRIDTRKPDEELALTNRLRTEGTTLLAKAAQKAGAEKLLVQSIAFAYHPDENQGPQGVSEEASLYHNCHSSFEETIWTVDQIDQIALHQPDLKGTVLRYGFFYGPGTIYSRNGTFAQDLKSGKIALLRKSVGRFSFIHVDDAAEATVKAIEGDVTGIINIVDDHPVEARNWIPEYAQMLDTSVPWTVPRLLGRIFGGAYAVYMMCHQPGADNSKAKKALQWTPTYPHWKEGFQSMLAE